MRNPWADLPRVAPFVLPDDRPFVEAFNHWWPRGSHHHLDLTMFPDPFVGRRTAPIVMLARNPGIGGGADRRLHRSRSDLKRIMRQQLTASPGRATHTYLLPEFEGTPGGKWWRSALRYLADDGINDATLAKSVLAIEFHGYHSTGYSTMPVTLPSQHYGFWLVRQAMDRGALILLVRGRRDWTIAVPELLDYDGLLANRNPRSASVSPGTYGTSGYRRIRALLD